MGALFYYELVRLARRPQRMLIRCGYILAVFVTLFVVCEIRFPGQTGTGISVSGDEMAKVAKKLVALILTAQTAAVILLTPVYVSDVIAGDRERGTLDLLLTSQLSERQIVLGKLLARSLDLCYLFLAGLPVLLVSQLWGAVDPFAVAFAFLVTFLNVFSVGALCALVSAAASTRARALMSSYSIVWYFVFLCSGCCCLTPSATFDQLAGGAARTLMASLPVPYLAPFLAARAAVVVLVICVTANALIAYVSIRMAATALNPLARRRGGKSQAGSKASRATFRGVFGEWSNENNRLSLQPRPLPPMSDRPLLWRELSSSSMFARFLEANIFPQWRLFLFVAAILLLPLLPLRWLAKVHGPTLTGFWLAGRIALLVPLALGCAVVAMRSAESLGRDRDSRTLDSLLALPVSRSELFDVKWIGALLRFRGFAYVAAAVAAVDLVVGGLRFDRLPLLAVGVAVHSAFFASLGLWLSLVCRTTLAARVTMAVVLIVAAGFAVFAGNELDWLGLRTRAVPQWVATAEAVLPPASWWSLALSPDDAGLTARNYADRSVTAGVAVMAFAALAVLLRADALRRFRNLGLG